MKPNCSSSALVVAMGVLLGCSLAACKTVPKSSSRPLELFNGRDLANWKHVAAEASTPLNDTWTVRDGYIVCSGKPLGFLYAPPVLSNFRLTVEYRWAPGTKPGNSGIFSRLADFNRALPRTVEVQLMHGNAGDILTLQGMPLQAGQPRHFAVANHAVAGDISGVKKVADAERPAGEWNTVVIEANGPQYVVWVNGQQINTATGIEVIPGRIALQSEGGEIHFRRVSVLPGPEDR